MKFNCARITSKTEFNTTNARFRIMGPAPAATNCWGPISGGNQDFAFLDKYHISQLFFELPSIEILLQSFNIFKGIIIYSPQPRTPPRIDVPGFPRGKLLF